MNLPDDRLLRIGVFYDGNYFLHVSNYYNFSHDRRARISIFGLHEFIRAHAAELEGTDTRRSKVVDAHYFRGRLPAHEANSRNKLLSERLFDDILMKEGIVTHYLPAGPRGDRDTDVWLSLEAYELTMLKQYNVVVLLACDGDFVPLVRKIQSHGTRVMVLGWDFEYTDEFGNDRVTVTSAALLKECTYPVAMHDLINDPAESELVDSLFVPKDGEMNYNRPASAVATGGNGEAISDERFVGRVQNVKDGYGFIENPEDTQGRNLFFYWEDVNGDFNALEAGDWVEYSLGRNHRGECAVEVNRLDSAP